jgi:hypothetical protein
VSILLRVDDAVAALLVPLIELSSVGSDGFLTFRGVCIHMAGGPIHVTQAVGHSSGRLRPRAADVTAGGAFHRVGSHLLWIQHELVRKALDAPTALQRTLPALLHTRAPPHDVGDPGGAYALASPGEPRYSSMRYVL